MLRQITVAHVRRHKSDRGSTSYRDYSVIRKYRYFSLHFALLIKERDSNRPDPWTDPTHVQLGHSKPILSARHMDVEMTTWRDYWHRAGCLRPPCRIFFPFIIVTATNITATPIMPIITVNQISTVYTFTDASFQHACLSGWVLFGFGDRWRTWTSWIRYCHQSLRDKAATVTTAKSMSYSTRDFACF